MEAIMVILGLVAGFFTGYYIMNAKSSSKEGDYKALESQFNSLKEEAARTEARLQNEKVELESRLLNEKVEIETRLQKDKSDLEIRLLKEKEDVECRLQKEKADLKDESLAEREALKRENALEKETLKTEFQKEREALKLEHIREMDEVKRNAERVQASALALQKENSDKALEAMQKQFDQTISKMEAQLKVATEEMLRRRQEEFSKSSQEKVGMLLQPLEKSLSDMRRAVADNTTKHDEIGGKLSQGLQDVIAHSDNARKSAEKLADALRGGGRIQGDWGETVLTELLTSQGLTEGVHYVTQPTMRDENGEVIITEDNKRMRPDVILHLDSQRDVIIDAKVSLSAFLDYMNSETEEMREKALREHVQSIEKHVAELVRKDYSSFTKSVDYVIMFVPNTAALYAATNRKHDLWRNAMNQGVYIADEQTLYAALKIIDMTWRQIVQAENHEKVYELANEMLDRVGAFMGEYVKVGNELDSARKAYDEGMKKIQERGHSIPQTCGKLKKLGAKMKKEPKGVPQTLLGIADEDEID